MINILIVYLCGAALVAGGLSWVMVRKLDEYDWSYDKGDIWFNFSLMVLIWPLVLLGWIKSGKPDLVGWLRPKSSHAAFQRDTEQVYRNLQPCGAYVRYKPAQLGISDGCYGEFIFPSQLVELRLIKKLQTATHLKQDHEGELLDWLQSRDETIQEPVDVPQIWSRFIYLLGDLIAQDKGLISCGICQDTIELHDKSLVAGGHSLKRYECPNGHELVDFEDVRLTYRLK